MGESVDLKTIMMQTNVYKQFMFDKDQNLAYDTIIGTLLRGEMVWCDTKHKNKDVRIEIKKNTKEYNVWTSFIREYIRQICVFGFAVYRVARVPSKHNEAKLQVANSQNFVLYWSDKKHDWDVRNEGDESFTQKGKWFLSVYSEPMRFGTTNVLVPASCATMAYHDSVKLAHLNDNILKRDEINSIPAVYTQSSQRIMGASARPNNTDTNRNSVGLVDETVHDMTMFMKTRLDTLKRFDAMSKQLRDDATKAYKSKSIKEGKKPQKIHDAQEYFITDGRDMKEITFRRSPEDLDKLCSTLSNNILFAWKIPPQALGMNINSERLASSDRLTQMAISRYDDHIKDLRNNIQFALSNISKLIMKDSPTVEVQLRPIISAFALSQIEPILKTNIAQQLISRVYDVPVDYIDKERLAKRQRLATEEKHPQTTNNGGDHASNMHDASGEASTAVRNKPSMSESQKQKRRDEKAQS